MKDLSELLILWYRSNKRELPWRETDDIYKVWLSEVILQQTRVEQGLPYYQKFLSAFPDVHSLARATEKQVMKTWEGLGYYSRARNLHATAKYVSGKRKGKFPGDYEGLLQLKGIGPYTAAAISSFCFNEPRPVTDGNVFRFLTRLFGISTPVDTAKGKEIVLKKAEQLMEGRTPSEFNQAIMEFGALYCKPMNPECKQCIFLAHCHAGMKNSASRFPKKEKKKPVKDRYLTFFICRWNEQVLVELRTSSDIWKGLYQFPLIEFGKKEPEANALKNFKTIYKLRSSDFHIHGTPSELIHLLSHQRLHGKMFVLDLKKKMKPGPSQQWIDQKKLKHYPIPRMLSRFLSKLS